MSGWKVVATKGGASSLDSGTHIESHLARGIYRLLALLRFLPMRPAKFAGQTFAMRWLGRRGLGGCGSRRSTLTGLLSQGRS